MSILFSPLTIKEITFKNRIAVSPMCQYSAVDGFANNWHLVHLGSRAAGGAGLVIQEATAVSPEGRITSGDAGLYTDEHIEKWKNIVQFIHEQGAIAGIQLAHAGRKASSEVPWKGGKQIKKSDGGWTPVAASAIPFYDTDDAPVELDIAGIQKIINDFENAAKRAVQAGYKVLEIHAAHGYLIHQFLSPLSNTRIDEYGGSFENRIRLLIEILVAVQKVWPSNLPLFVRLSATDWAMGGWDEISSIQLAGILKTAGADLIDCSSGGAIPHVKIPAAPGYQVAFAQNIKKNTGILTGAVGMITNAQQAEEILTLQQADIILIAREFLRNPYFAFNAAKEMNDKITWPPQYERARL